MAGLVLGVLVPSVMSVAVTVWVPSVANVMLKVLVPETKAALAGKVAPGSLVVMPPLCVTLVTSYQVTSTAFTVTLNATQVVCGVGVPALPLAVPAAAGV